MQLGLGLVIGILAIAGDLVVSFAKRVANIKDSGVFFPGYVFLPFRKLTADTEAVSIEWILSYWQALGS